MLIRTDIPTEAEMDELVPPRRGRATSMADLAASAVGRLARKTRLKLPVISEAMLQRRILQGFQLYGIYGVHYPMEGRRSDWERMEQKRNGSAKNFPDLMLYKRGGLHGLMELKRPGWKAPKSGASLKAWEHRVEYHDYLRGLGIPVESCITSWDEALAAVKAWGWIR